MTTVEEERTARQYPGIVIDGREWVLDTEGMARGENSDTRRDRSSDERSRMWIVRPGWRSVIARHLVTTKAAHLLRRTAASCEVAKRAEAGTTCVSFPQGNAAFRRLTVFTRVNPRGGALLPLISAPILYVIGGKGSATLDVEIGHDRVRLYGVSTNEQAIAGIEEHIRGKKDPGEHVHDMPPQIF